MTEISARSHRTPIVFLLAAALALSTLVVGAPARVAAQDDMPKLVMWGWPTTITGFFDEGDDTFVNRIRDELGIELELVLVDQPELGPKLKAALPAGQGPDLVATDFDVMGPYWSFLEPLDAFAVAEWGEDWHSNFSGASVDEIALVGEIAGKPGETMYLPGNVQLLGWFISSRPVLEEVGIDPASLASYDDLIAACGQISEAGYIPVVMGGHPAALVDVYQTMVEISAPGKMELAQMGQASFADEDMAGAFDLIAGFFSECTQEGAIAAEVDAALFSLLFGGEGATSFAFTGTPWFGFVADTEGGGADFMATSGGTFVFPGSKGLAATDAGVGIVADSENKEAAWEVVKWIAAGEENARLAARGEPVAFVGNPPAGKGTDFDEFVQEPLIEAMATGDNKFRRVLCPDVYNALTQVIPGVVSGQIDAATAGLEVQDAFDRGCQDWVR